MNSKSDYKGERIQDLEETLENGLTAISEAIGVNGEHYDTDQADIACYMDCFNDAAKALKKFGIVWDGDEGEFVQIGEKLSR